MPRSNAVPILDGGDSINRGLRGWWPLTEAGGLVARDISTYRNEAIQQTGSTAVETGLVGKYRRFSPGGATGRLRTDNFAWPASSGITVSAWVNGTATTANTLFSLGPSSGTDYGKAFVPYLDGNVYWDYNGEGAGRISTSFSAFSGKWTLVTLVNNGVDFKAIYFNGVLQTSSGTVASPPIATNGFQFGEWNGAYHNNTGVQNARVWSRALRPSEIMRLYREPWAGAIQNGRRSFDVASGGPITGSAAITLGALTSTGTGTLSITGTGARTLAALTSAGTGTLAIGATGAATLAALTSTGSATLTIEGALGVTLDALASAGTGTLDITGEGAATLDDLTSASTEAPTTTTGGRLRRYRRQIVWDDPPPELAPVVSLAQNYADDLAVERAVDAAIAKIEAMSVRASMARRARVVEEVKAVILDAIERAAEQDDEDALIALL